MISTNNFRTGVSIDIDEGVCSVVEFLHVKPGKGAAFVRTKLRNVETGAVFEKTFRAGEKVKRAHLEDKPFEYLYKDGDHYVFMDQENYEQVSLTEEELGKENILFLKDNTILTVKLYKNKPISVEMPNFVILAVTDTEPGFKGNTVSGGTKPATLETGAIVSVPLFIEEGDLVKVDTRTASYMERVTE